MGMYSIIPFSMKGTWRYMDALKLSVGNADAFRIDIGVEFGADGKASFCAGRRDQLNDGLECAQGFAAPVDGDERKQFVLYFVPLAGAAWEMTDCDGNLEFIRQSLQFHFP